MPNSKIITDFGFLGYRLHDLKLSCPGNRRIDSIGLKTSDYSMDDKKVLSFHLNFELKGPGDLVLTSVFECAYKVNEPIEVNIEDSSFVGMINNMAFIVLPYIRAAITTLTNDGLGPIAIPTLDLSRIDFVAGTKFVRKDEDK